MDDIASQLMRAIRGSRSQIAFCRKLGYRSNVATDWENGRRFPTALEALRAAERSHIDVDAALHDFHPQAALHLRDRTPAGLGRWLRALQGSATQGAVCARTGFSRHQVGRWLRGDAVPRLPEWLALVDALTGRMPDLVTALVDPGLVPAVAEQARARRRAARLLFDVPWSPAVLALLSIAPEASIPDLAAPLGLSEDRVQGVVDALVDAHLVQVEGGRVRAVADLTSTVRGSEADRAALRRHWVDASRARLERPEDADLIGFNVFAVSHPDMDRIRDRYRAFYREVRAIVAASEPAQTAGLLLCHVVEWGSPLPDPTE